MKIAIIRDCIECPHIRWAEDRDPYCCKFNFEDIKDLNVIPEWCPLEDYKSEKS